MPGKAACSKLKGKAKADCLAYKGKYAKRLRVPLRMKCPE